MDIKEKYGVSDSDLVSVTLKIKNQENFLKYSYIKNNLTGQTFSLKDCIVSSNHNPQRYYGEIQNRIDTLQREAENSHLTPVFLTMTLPSEFHRLKQTKSGRLIKNPKYNGVEPKEAVKILTKMWSKLRHDRALKELTRSQRMYYKVNEPHKDGTPHTHILLFVPVDRIKKIKIAFKRLFDDRGNDIQDDIKNSTAYIMKYINKTLPLSKQENLSEKDKYLNAWYSKNRVIRFNSSKTLAPLVIYRLLHKRYSMYALTKLINENHFKIYVTLDTNKIIEILDEFGDLVYARNDSFNVCLMGSNLKNYSQQNNTLGRSA